VKMAFTAAVVLLNTGKRTGCYFVESIRKEVILQVFCEGHRMLAEIAGH
jgi:hypothetical protein